MGLKHLVEVIIAHVLGFFVAVDTVAAIDIGNDFPERVLFDLANRPLEGRRDGDQLRSPESSVIVEELVPASAGGAFPSS